MQLLVMRHGEAEVYADSDQSRQLTSYGKQQAAAAGDCLAELGLGFDQLWLSPYVRAKQTAKTVLSRLHISTDLIQLTRDILTPDSSPATFLSALESSEPKPACLLLVSHQPFVSHLISALTDANEYNLPPMATASMALLESETIAAGCFNLQWLRHSPEFNASRD